MDVLFLFYVGIDWGTELHRVCVMNHEGTVLNERQVKHSGTALGEFVDWLTKLCDDAVGRVAVGIEMPHGAVVESLLERGFSVYSINPKQLDRFRDRFSPAGAKDDSRDALVLADSLRTDRHCFREVEIDDPLIIELRELTRVGEDLRKETNRLSNRLRAQLHRFYPQVLTLSPSANEPWIWALLEVAPTPERARTLRPIRLERLLRRHRIRRFSPDVVLAALREPALTVAPGTTEAASAHISLLIPRLRLVAEQHKTVQSRIKKLLEQMGDEECSASDEAAPGDDGNPSEHRDVDIILSTPGIGITVAATMLAEAHRALRHRDYRMLRVQCGIAPVTKQSGKRRRVEMRRACNNRLRNAVYHRARVAAQGDLHARSHYHDLRSRRHTHGRALRSVADREMAMLMAMLKSGTTHDPARRHHGGTAVAAKAA